MVKPKRLVAHTANETFNPPASLGSGLMICQVIKPEGKNIYSVKNCDGDSLLVELPSRFRSTIWIKRGSFVLIDATTFQSRENKIDGEIANIVGDEKLWMKMSYWPREFHKSTAMNLISDVEDNDKKILLLDETGEED